MKIKAYMICHTHWDREWYLTKEAFLPKLVRLIDGLLDIIETVPDYVSFMLDGQTIAIEDYLKVKPYNEKRLINALRSGKIISGPWYVLPDELLISGESHIRNYMMGAKVIQASGQKMNVAYLPDSFGHPCQMPQIIEGLGMDTMVFWRGVPKDISSTEFYWKAPYSNSKVLCVHMPFGYGNTGNLSLDMTKTIPRLKRLINNLSTRTNTDMVLLMNGSDHLVGQSTITEIVESVNKQLPEYLIELSTMENYLNNLKSRLSSVKSYTGEFRSGDCTMLLGGTLSTRMYLKQKNDCIQRKMERYLEPMLAGEVMLGSQEDMKGYGDYIWKKILENHPHDSICGCSIDKVHQAMMERFSCLEQLLNTLMTDTVQRIQMFMASEEGNESVRLFLFEPSNDKIKSYIETEIILDNTLVQSVDFDRSVIVDYEPQIVPVDLPNGLKITDEQGREIPYVILESDKDYDTLYQDHTMPEIYKVNKLKVGLLLPEFEYGFHQLFVEKSASAGARIEISNSNAIENEYYRIQIEDGEITVFDKDTGRIHYGVGNLIDKGDAGDEYTYSWPETDKVYKLAYEKSKVFCKKHPEIRETLMLKAMLIIPESLSNDRKRRSETLIECPVEIEVTLTKGIDRIDFRISVDNRAKDHRLQVQLPSGIQTTYSEASDTFHVTKHPTDVEIPKDWMEYPQTTNPTHGFINLENKDYGMSVSTVGLMEYEAEQLENQSVINLTLLRCVGWLSRTDLLTRKGNGGWTIETPKAQCIGNHTFEFSISYHAGSWRKYNRLGLMEKYRTRPYICQLKTTIHYNVNHRNPLHFVDQLPEVIRISALKIAENGQGIILRIYNIAEEDINFHMVLPDAICKVSMVNLNEKRKKDIEMKSQSICLLLHSWEIKTLCFALRTTSVTGGKHEV